MTPSDDTPMSESPPSMGGLALMTDRLKALSTRIEDTWWDIGALLDQVACRDLASALGHSSYYAYAQRVLNIPTADAKRYRRVAHHFAQPTAMQHGAERLDLLLSYVEASPRALMLLDPLRVTLPVVGLDGREILLPFPEVTTEDLQRAVRVVRRRKTTSDPTIPRDVSEARDDLAAVLAEKVWDRNVHLRVHQAPGAGEEYSLTLMGLTPFNMAEVAAVLLAEAQAVEQMGKDDTATKPKKGDSNRSKSRTNEPAKPSRSASKKIPKVVPTKK